MDRNNLKPFIEILECTLRDGSYEIQFSFSSEDTYIYTKMLANAGFRKIEVAHGVGLGASSKKYGISKETDIDYINAAVKAAPHAKIGVFFIPGIGTEKDLLQAVSAGLGFIRIGTNSTETENGHKFLKLAKKHGLEVSYNFMKSYAISPAELLERAKPIVDFGCDVLCVVDSAGCMLPEQVKQYTSSLISTNAKVGFHGHDNLSMALTNILAAIEEGATVVDSSLQGMGRGAGNAQTEVLVELLHQYGYQTGVDLFKVLSAGEQFRKAWNYTKGKTALDIIIGKAKFHSSFLKLFQNIANEQQVDLHHLILEVSKIDVVHPTELLIRNVAKKMRNFV